MKLVGVAEFACDRVAEGFKFFLCHIVVLFEEGCVLDGNINFADRACCQLLSRSVEEVKDVNFFWVLTQPDRSATMMVSVPVGSNSRELAATCSISQWDSQRLLVTQLG